VRKQHSVAQGQERSFDQPFEIARDALRHTSRFGRAARHIHKACADQLIANVMI